jgi:hypothetical protein
MPDKHSIDRGGPGQSGAASGLSHFDDSKPGEQRYPADTFPSGSRSRFDDGGHDTESSNPDDQLRSAIFASLREAQIDVSKLEVMVSGGIVTLTGTVEDGPSLSLAEDRVEHIPGVDEVRNEILVEGH